MGRVSELTPRKKIGWPAGFTLLNDGGRGMFGGSRPPALAMPDSMSWAAASMLRSSVNWIVMEVLPSELEEFIESMPAMVENWFSSGVATEEAMVSGLAPGRLALTWMVG